MRSKTKMHRKTIKTYKQKIQTICYHQFVLTTTTETLQNCTNDYNIKRTDSKNFTRNFDITVGSNLLRHTSKQNVGNTDKSLPYVCLENLRKFGFRPKRGSVQTTYLREHTILFFLSNVSTTHRRILETKLCLLYTFF